MTIGGYVTGGTDAGHPSPWRAAASPWSDTRATWTQFCGRFWRKFAARRSRKKNPQWTLRPTTGPFWSICWPTALLSDDPAERYSTGWLEEVASDVRGIDRVCWLAADVTVPAGGSVTLTASMAKAGSYDFYCADRGNQGLYGYDLVTALGSCLPCTDQQATLEDRGVIEIVRQNFGLRFGRGNPHRYPEPGGAPLLPGGPQPAVNRHKKGALSKNNAPIDFYLGALTAGRPLVFSVGADYISARTGFRFSADVRWFHPGRRKCV